MKSLSKSHLLCLAAFLLGAMLANAQSVIVPEYDIECSEFIRKAVRGRAQQGLEIYDKYVFNGEDGGHVNVFDFNTADSMPIGQFELASSCPDNHANNFEFGVETKAGASFPLLYITNGKVGSDIEWTCFVESITLKDGVFSSEIAQTIVLDGCKGWKEKGYQEIFGAPSWLVDREEKALWVFSAKQRTTLKMTKNCNDNLYIATKFRLPALAEGEKVILGVNDILDQKTFPYDVWFTQAGCIHGGKIFYGYGVGKQDWDRPSVIEAYDLKKGVIAARYEIQEEIPYEIEDIAIRDGWMYVNTNTTAGKGIDPVIYKLSLPKNVPGTPYVRNWLSHRGVHLGYTIAGENSLEAIEYAKRAGFKFIETDCRWTKDGVMVIVHDATLNRTFTMADGSPIKEATPVNSITFEQLRKDYRLKAGRPEYRGVCPTLEEYLIKCKEVGFKTVFIEPKIENDSTGRFYQEVIDIADRVLTRDNYVVCSRNSANHIIRGVMQPNDKSLKSVTLMEILYQSDYKTATKLGNTIIAVNPTKYDGEEFHKILLKIKQGGRWSESNAGLIGVNRKNPELNLALFQRVYKEGNLVDFIATDLCAPDFNGTGTTMACFTATRPEQLVRLQKKLETYEFSGVFVDCEFDGKATLVVGPDRFKLDSGNCGGHLVYQRCLYDSKPYVNFEDCDKDFKLKKCSIRIVKF